MKSHDGRRVARRSRPAARASAAKVPTDVGRAHRTGLVATAATTRVSTRWAIGSLVGVNLVPLVGVISLGWSTFDVMMLYWFENGVVGLFVALKMLLTEGHNGSHRGTNGLFGKLLMIYVFTVSYAAYWSAHGYAIVALFSDGGPFGWAPDGFISLETDGPRVYFAGGWTIATTYVTGSLLVGAVGLLVSHGITFVGNVVRRGEELRTAPIDLIVRPYPRVVLLQLALGAGGYLVLTLGEPLAALAFFVLLKIVFEVTAHLYVRQPR